MNIFLRSESELSKKTLESIQDEMTVAHDDHKGALLRRALFKTSDHEKSQDLVQTTFLKTLLYLRRGGRIDLMRSFLNHILNDLIIDEYRKNKLTSLDVLLAKGFEPGSDEYTRNVNIYDGKDVVLLIPELPKKYEVAIRMRYLQGLSLKEMALLTDQSENTCAVQVHRGLNKLKKIYADTRSIKGRALTAKT